MLLQKQEPLSVEKRIFSSSSLPFNLPRETRSSARRQTNSCTNLETRYFTRRQLLARERRSRREQIVRENRAARNIAHSDVNLFSNTSTACVTGRKDCLQTTAWVTTKIQTDETPHDAQEFNLAAASFLSTPYMFNYPNLHHELNCVLPSLQFNVVERRTETPTKLL